MRGFWHSTGRQPRNLRRIYDFRMATLTDPQTTLLQGALAYAFNEDKFEIFLFEDLEQRLDNLAPGNMAQGKQGR